MDVKKIHPLLENFKIDSKATDTVYDGRLKTLFKSLIAEYMKKKSIIGSTDQLKSTPKNFFAGEINDWIKANGDFIQREKFITDSYLSNLAFPHEEKAIHNKETIRLIVIFNFLFENLAEDRVLDLVDTALKLKEFPRNSIKPKVTIPFNGAVNITNDYFKKFDLENVTASQFYLKKDEPNYQWSGIINGWDKPRNKYNKLLASIEQSFFRKSSSYIAAIITGQAGSGKSTLVRRLAYDMRNDDKIILWATSFQTLNKEVEKLSDKYKFLIIIEDWDAISGDENTTHNFLYQISQQNNVRLVIGDRFTDDKLYSDGIEKKNIFKLDSRENEILIEWILSKNPDWKSVYYEVFKNESLYDTSLYLILFILGRTFALKNSDKIAEIKSVKAKFKAIVKYDLTTLNKRFRKLGQVLSLYAKLFISHHILLSWEAFWDSAKEYCFGDEIQLFGFDDDMEIHEILSYYVYKASIHKLLVPKLYPFQFHHDLLAEEIAAGSYAERKQISSSTLESFYQILIKHKQWHSAAGFSKLLPQKDVLERSSIQKLLEFGNVIERVNSEATVIENEIMWEMEFVYLLHFRVTYPLDEYSFKKILKALVDRGCKADCISNALAKGDNIEVLHELFIYYLSKLRIELPRYKDFGIMLKEYRKARALRRMLLNI